MDYTTKFVVALIMPSVKVDRWDGWTTNNGLNKHMKLVVNLVGRDDCILVEASEPQKQLEGQMCIEDWFGDQKGERRDGLN